MITNEEIYREALQKIADAQSEFAAEEMAKFALAMGSLSDTKDSSPRETQRDWVIERMVEINQFLQDALLEDAAGDRCEGNLKSAQETLLRTMAAL